MSQTLSAYTVCCIYKQLLSRKITVAIQKDLSAKQDVSNHIQVIEGNYFYLHQTIKAWSNLWSDLQLYASFEFEASWLVWGTIGPIHNQGTKKVLRKETAVTENVNFFFFSCVYCKELGELPAAEHFLMGIVRGSISSWSVCGEGMEQINKMNRKKILEPDGFHLRNLKGLKDELAEIIIVHGLLFKTGLEPSTWK